MDRIGGINNFNKHQDSINNPYDFELLYKILYETGRLNTHYGVIETFSYKNNTNTNNATRNNNLGRET